MTRRPLSTASVTPLTERARAKVNLTLAIRGRRPDGYHELESLVAFADVADCLVFDPAAPAALGVTGPFADALGGHDNLVSAAMQKVGLSGAFTLEKNLPVAAGIGGGSADAGAALRLLRRAHPTPDHVDWTAIAASLGADVPVCFENRAAVMTGIGDKLHPLRVALALPAVLVNPMVPVPAGKTGAVFKALGAPPVAAGAASPRVWPETTVTQRDALIAALAETQNDLEAPASAVTPIVGVMLSALRAVAGARVVRLSGAGPTGFALFDTEVAARAGAAHLLAQHPTWWVRATHLR